MRRDEFNNINVTNDQQLRGVEFGKTVKFDFSTQRENQVNKEELNNIQPKDELNEGASSSRKDNKVEHTSDELQKQLSESGSSSSSSSSVASGSAEAASSSSAAAASGGAATVASATAVSASVVAVTAFTVITAAPIILSQAKAELKSFDIGSTGFAYEVELLDTLDTEEYHVILYNETYNESQDIEAGITTGIFSELEPNTEYTFDVEEGDSSEIKRNLLRKTFTTSGQLSVFNNFYFDETANFLTRTFEVQLDYYDELAIYSDFTFTISDIEDADLSYTYNLSYTTEVQTLSLDEPGMPFNYEEELQYIFSYYENDQEIVYSSGTFTFTDISGGVSEFRGGTVSNLADFYSYNFTVTLDYVDDFNFIDDVYLVIYMDEEEGDARTYELALTTDPQTLSARADEELDIPPLDLESGESFYYHFKYTYKGVSQTTERQTVVFKDAEDRETEFYGGVVSSQADFLDNTFNVQLSYVDDFDRLDDFVLHIYEDNAATADSFSRDYSLSKVTTEQTLSANEYGEEPGFDVSTGEYSYYFSYTNNGIEYNTDVATVTFTDAEGRVSTFNGITINEADFEDEMFYLTLDFDDSLDRLDSFHITLYDNDINASVSYDLSETTDEQCYPLYDSENEVTLDVERHSMSYLLTYNDNGVQQSVSDSTTFTDKQNRTSHVSGVTFNEDGNGNVYYNFYTYEIEVTLDYENYFDYYDDFRLWFYYDGTSEEDYYEVSLAENHTTQYINTSDSMEHGVDFTSSSPINYKLIYHTVEDSDTHQVAASGSFTCIDSSQFEINDIKVGQVQFEDTDSQESANYYIPFKLDYIDDRSEIGSVSVYIKLGEDNYQYLYMLSETGGVIDDDKWQYGYFSYSQADVHVFFDNPVTIVAKNSSEEEIYTKVVSLTLDDNTGDFEILDIRLLSAPFDGSLESEECSFQYSYMTASGDYTEKQFTLRFIDEDGNCYDIEDNYMSSGAFTSGTITFTTSGHETFVQKVLNGDTFKVNLVYIDSSDKEVEISCYTSFRFSF